MFPKAVLPKVRSINLQADVYSAMLGKRTTLHLCIAKKKNENLDFANVQFHGFLVNSKIVC